LGYPEACVFAAAENDVPTHRLFPTLIYATRLAAASSALNARLLRECLQLELDDTSGRRWSARHYPNGFSSYNSAHRMHEVSPTFARLAVALDRHVLRFAGQLALDLAGRELAMTDCWVNVMREHAAHGSHLHPLSTISGTYYVETPANSAGLKFEDPRLERFMAAPPRKRGNAGRPWIEMPAKSGCVLLFESWLRHEVTGHRGAAPRVSISFNYNWF
jgi:uncharacterized protein (TIGR02466 family)